MDIPCGWRHSRLSETPALLQQTDNVWLFFSRKSSFKQLSTFLGLLWEETLHSRKDLRSEIPSYVILGNWLSFLQPLFTTIPRKADDEPMSFGYYWKASLLVRNELILLKYRIYHVTLMPNCLLHGDECQHFWVKDSHIEYNHLTYFPDSPIWTALLPVCHLHNIWHHFSAPAHPLKPNAVPHSSWN